MIGFTLEMALTGLLTPCCLFLSSMFYMGVFWNRIFLDFLQVSHLVKASHCFLSCYCGFSFLSQKKSRENYVNSFLSSLLPRFKGHVLSVENARWGMREQGYYHLSSSLEFILKNNIICLCSISKSTLENTLILGKAKCFFQGGLFFFFSR